MVSFKYHTASSSYPEELLLNLKSNISPDLQNITRIVSGIDSEFVHIALLRKVNVFLYDILSVSKYCESIVLVLPYSPPGTLSNLVALLYAGQVSGLPRIQAQQLLKLAEVLKISLTNECKENRSTTSSINYETDKLGQENSDYEDEDEINEHHHPELKIKTKKVNKFGNLVLCFPKRRINRQKEQKQTKENFICFQRRVQAEYNNHPVGMYMGPYDQNKNLELKIQVPDSDLNFRNYTQFHHDGQKCFALKIKSYEKYDILEKIDAYRIAKEIVIDNESESDSETGSDNNERGDKKTYTCQFRTCKIPCPCPQCHLDQPQCLEHKIKHVSLFDETNHAISIRSSQEYCLDQSFFKKSYISRFSGIPISCKNCKSDLLAHHSYHFEYHEKCRFCKQSWYKHKAETKEELKNRGKEEENYFKRVCPYCNKQFIRASHVRSHVKYAHEGKKFKCGFCEKVFNSPQAKACAFTYRQFGKVQ